MTEDEKIIELFFARSERAIGALDEKYGRLCRGLSYNIVGDRRDAEECVNDAYLGAWNAIPPARPDPLRAYILKIVRNLSLKCRCRNKADKRGGNYAAVLEEIGDCAAGGDGPESALEARELARVIESFLDTLTAENRVIFMRRYWFADSYRDIAGLTGLTEKNVSVRLSRARGKLRRYLSKRGVDI